MTKQHQLIKQICTKKQHLSARRLLSAAIPELPDNWFVPTKTNSMKRSNKQDSRNEDLTSVSN